MIVDSISGRSHAPGQNLANWVNRSFSWEAATQRNGRPFRLQCRQLRLETVYSNKVTCRSVCAIDLSLEGEFPLDQLLRICIAFRA